MSVRECIVKLVGLNASVACSPRGVSASSLTPCFLPDEAEEVEAFSIAKALKAAHSDTLTDSATRMVVARVTHNHLVLQVSLFPGKSSASPLCLLFTSPLVPAVCLFPELDPLKLVVGCQNGQIHFLRISLKSLKSPVNLTEVSLRSHYIHNPNSKSVVAVHAPTPDCALVAFSDASFVLVDAPADDSIDENEPFSEVSLSTSNYIFNLPLNLLNVGRDSSVAPIALTSVHIDESTIFLLALCQNRKLHIWNQNERRFLKTVTVPGETNLPDRAGNYLNVFDKSRSSFKIAIFIPGGQASEFGSFVFVQLDLEANLSLTREINYIGREAMTMSDVNTEGLVSLVDYTIRPAHPAGTWEIWVALTCGIRFKSFCLETEEEKTPWSSAYARPEPIFDIQDAKNLVDQGSTVDTVYGDFILHPGRFDLELIKSHISSIHQAPLDASESLEKTIFRTIRAYYGAFDGSQYSTPEQRQKALDQYLLIRYDQFLSDLMDKLKKRDAIIGLFCDSTNLKLVVKRNIMDVIVRRHEVEALNNLGNLSDALLNIKTGNVRHAFMRNYGEKSARIAKSIAKCFDSAQLRDLHPHLVSFFETGVKVGNFEKLLDLAKSTGRSVRGGTSSSEVIHSSVAVDVSEFLDRSYLVVENLVELFSIVLVADESGLFKNQWEYYDRILAIYYRFQFIRLLLVERFHSLQDQRNTNVEASTLVEFLVRRHFPPAFDQFLDVQNLVSDMTSRFLVATGLLDFTTEKSVLVLANIFEASNQVTVLKKWEKWLNIMPNASFATMFIRAKVSIRLQDVEGHLEFADSEFSRAAQEYSAALPKFSLMEFLPAQRHVRTLYHYGVYVLELFRAAKAHTFVVKWGLFALTQFQGQENVMSERTSLYREIFQAHLNLKNYAGAFQAMMMIPDGTSKLSSLSVLVQNMAECKAIDQLCDFDFGTLTQTVDQRLRTEALSQGVWDKPDYYRIAYAWRMHRGNFQGAATIMYLKSRRAAVDREPRSMSDIVKLRGRCLLATINALSQVSSPRYQWVSFHVDSSHHKKRRINENPYNFIPKIATDIGSREIDVVALGEIRKEYALVKAQSVLLAKFEGSKELSISTFDEVMECYLTENMFDSALSLASVFELDTTCVYMRLAKFCVNLSKLEQRGGLMDRVKPIIDEDGLSCSTAKRAWNLLRNFLDKDEMPKKKLKGYQCYISDSRKAVIDFVLLEDPRFNLPPWLTAPYRTSHFEDLLRIYLKHGLLEEAAKFAIKYISAESKKLPPLDKLSQALNRWMPYDLLGQLEGILEEEIENSAGASGYADILQDNLNNYRFVIEEYGRVLEKEANDLRMVLR